MSRLPCSSHWEHLGDRVEFAWPCSPHTPGKEFPLPWWRAETLSKPGLAFLGAEHLPADRDIPQAESQSAQAWGEGRGVGVGKASPWLPPPPRPRPRNAAVRWRPNIPRTGGNPAGCVGMAQ